MRMKNISIMLLAVIGLGLASFTNLVDLPIGADLPLGDTKMKDIGGKTVTLKEAKGKNGLLVMFTCNTCPYVIKNQERTNEICKYAADKGVGVVLVNSNEAQRNDADSYNAMKTYAKEQGYSWYYAVDENSALADAFGANRTPETYLFNKEGKLVYHGAIDDNPSDGANVTRYHLKEAINETLANRTVSVSTSKSVGCSIKRNSKQ